MESLYTKYRPQTFADVVGQEHVVSTLERAVLENRVSHAYLFCGPRGTGKTTMARLLAKALLCECGPGQLPDGTCEECRLIAAGNHPDVYELDAASRTGVDNVREEIISNVEYAPVRGRYKAYIIDEVHMLTPAAFNALLKTLEEPPAHVVFMLCTTDPQKIPETVLSRVQRFDFHAISNDDLVKRLSYVCEQEGFTYETEALELVARHARGGLRDALSTLEQLSVFGDGTISLAATRDMLGALSSSQLSQVLMALAQRDVPKLFSVVGDLVDEGHDLLRFVRQLAARVRDAYVMSVAGEIEGAFTGDDLVALRAEADAFGSPDRLARVLTVLGDASSEMRTAPNQRLVLEIALTRLARPKTDLTLESLAERVSDLEAQIQALVSHREVHVPAAPSMQQNNAPKVSASVQPENAAQKVSKQSATPRQHVAPKVAPAAATAPKPASTTAAPATPATASASAPQTTSSTARPTAAQPQKTADQPKAAPTSAPKTTVQARAAHPADSGALQRNWRRVMEEMVQREPSRGSLLITSTAVSDDGETLTVSLPQGSSFALRMLERPDVRAVLDPQVAAVFGPRKTLFIEGAARAQAKNPAVQKPVSAPQPAPVTQVAPAVEAASTVQALSTGAAEPVISAPVPTQAPAASPEPQPSQVYAAAPAPEPAPFEEVPYSDADAAYYDELSEGTENLNGVGAPISEPAPVKPSSASATPQNAAPAIQEKPAIAQQEEPKADATAPNSDNAEENQATPAEIIDANTPFFSPDDSLEDGKVPQGLIEMLESAFDGEVHVSMIPASETEELQ